VGNDVDGRLDRGSMFAAPEWYDRGINWTARLGREVPVLTDVFGPPDSKRLLDAGCGTGRQAVAMCEAGFDVTGLDADAGMLSIASDVGRQAGVNIEWKQGRYDGLPEAVGGGFDGVYCLGNALAAAGTRAACRTSIEGFSSALRSGGRLFVQILNFRLMRTEQPCVRGPRVATRDGVDYVSVRHFAFADEECTVTNITMWNDEKWQQRAHCGTLFPIDVDDLTKWCEASGLRVDGLYGSYQREPFDVTRSTDLIVVATRISESA